MTDRQIQQSVKTRGVNFTVSPAIAQEIKKAGGTDALVGVLLSSYVTPVVNNPAATNSVANQKPTIEQVYDLAILSSLNLYFKLHNKEAAKNLLVQATQLIPTNYQAYQLLGPLFL